MTIQAISIHHIQNDQEDVSVLSETKYSERETIKGLFYASYQVIIIRHKHIKEYS